MRKNGSDAATEETSALERLKQRLAAAGVGRDKDTPVRRETRIVREKP
jgi:hypothetical protein